MDLYGIIGNPAHHSMSPPMHQAAYEEYGMDASFVTLESDPEDLEAAIRGADALGIQGLNVTMPFKEDVLDLVELDEVTSQIGAVNTIDFTGEGAPVGYNTDGVGARRALTHHGASMDGNAVVVGAGGTGRAISFALSEAGMSVDIHNRTVERATEVAEIVPGASSYGLDELSERVPEASVLVDATSVGMHEDNSLVPPSALHEDLTVLDAVYTPLETTLLRDANEQGATTVDGAWMLLFQGVEGFELWTDKEAPVDAMNDALREAL
ncbi:shikimate dehydrogenase [Natrarchaeobius chitinivorans]|uniref:Shikimate dehydrogenase (NADP(+)) n=1 Tax=Natrarchaeobius chitinivorans TaxID=1679083 RepID=A0A3N6MAW7_NATCH|nr:shikimate dehydrogenase [Natrarchaeobius chitinivorans]RQG93530.1 shikimate dehydrogenase [Natrarchaeobius chitinivorans]